MNTTCAQSLYASIQTASPDDPQPLLALRSDIGSVVHPLNGPILVGAAALGTWLPMLALAAFAGTPLHAPADGVRLPFLRDWNVTCMFLMTLPCLLWMLHRDHALLINALRTVHKEETVGILPLVATDLIERWNTRFKRINTQGLAAAVAVGIGVGVMNLQVYSPPGLGHWMAIHGSPTAAGWWFIACVTLFYVVTALYVIRSLAIWWFLQELAHASTVRPLPLHPDGCGGLRSIGELGLRNQYLLTVFGMNLILLALTSKTYLGDSTQLNDLVSLASWAYVLLGPAVFIAPLLPFRGAMLRTKMEVQSQVALRLRQELRRIREALPHGEIARSDEEIVDRLRKVAALVDELPVWPFDTGTLKKFTAAYLTPAIAFLVGFQDLVKHGGNLLRWLIGLVPM